MIRIILAALILSGTSLATDWSLVATLPPVVFSVQSAESIELTVYSLPGGQCPACVEMKRELSLVSWVRIVEQPAPQWVRSYPTIVWQTDAGSRVKIVGWSRGDVRKLKRAVRKHNRKVARLFADTDTEPADAFAVIPSSVPRQPVSVSRAVVRRPGPRWNYNGRWNVSRDYAANHLSSAHGIDPTGLTKQQIDVLHDNAHNGYKSRAAAVSRPAYCPTCPR